VKTAEEAIRTLVERLAESGRLRRDDCEGVVSAILKRESLGSTGIGRGVAIPHTKWPGIVRVVGTVGRVPSGVDFNSLDGMPVYVICLILAPADRPRESLRALEAISRQLRERR
jgi:PTS system fructose-specific IIA component/PTS system nitrogen regulatory IIA component